MKRCIDQYESPRGNSRLDGDSSFYSGNLGARVYLRWKLARYLQVSESRAEVSDEEADSRKREASDLIREAMRIAEDTSTRNAPSSSSSSGTTKPLRRVTLLCGSYVGATAMLAVLQKQVGQDQRAAETAHELIQQIHYGCSALPPSECDVLYGRAGALQAILFLRKELHSQSLGSQVVLALANEILNEGRRYASRNSNLGIPLLWEWHQSKYLGAAHGEVGILQTLLGLSASETSALDRSHQMSALIRRTIDKLGDYCFPSGNLDSSIKEDPRLHRQDKLVHWCHGAPGHILLLVRASQVWRDDSYLDVAKQIAEQVVWPRGLLRKGVGLCHGISGNAYVLLEVAGACSRTSNGSSSRLDFTSKAFCFLDFAMEHLNELEPVPDAPYSLYEGLAALSSLAIDMIIDPCQAKFPLYI